MSKRIRSVITRKKAQNTRSHKNINYGEIVIEFVAFINHFDFTNFEINYILKFEWPYYLIMTMNDIISYPICHRCYDLFSARLQVQDLCVLLSRLLKYLIRSGRYSCRKWSPPTRF